MESNMDVEYRQVFIDGVAVVVLCSIGAAYAADVFKGKPTTLGPVFNPGIGIGSSVAASGSAYLSMPYGFVAIGDALRNAEHADGASNLLKTSGKEEPKKSV
jgi:hypothetical protein